MTDINSVVLVGRLTRDAEYSQTKGGTSVLKFSIATNRRKKVGDEWKDETSFVDCCLFGKTAESLAQYMSKGKQIGISGEISQQRWQSQDGQNHSRVEIIVNTLQLLGGGKSDSKPTTSESINQPTESVSNDFEDDIPF